MYYFEGTPTISEELELSLPGIPITALWIDVKVALGILFAVLLVSLIFLPLLGAVALGMLSSVGGLAFAKFMRTKEGPEWFWEWAYRSTGNDTRGMLRAHKGIRVFSHAWCEGPCRSRSGKGGDIGPENESDFRDYLGRSRLMTAGFRRSMEGVVLIRETPELEEPK